MIGGLAAWGRPTWQNWLGNLRCSPRDSVAPRSLSELAAVVRYAHEEGRTVRMVGTGHSWMPLVPTDDCLVSSTRLNRLVAATEDTLTVETGMTVKVLLRHAAAHGLSVTGASMLREVSVGGLVATGSHGTGLRFGALSDHVVRMTVVDGRGRIVELEEGDPRLAAARLGLGATGCMHSVTLRFPRRFNVAVTEEFVPLEPTLDRLEHLARSHDLLSVYAIPGIEQAWIYRGDSTEERTSWRLDRRLRERLRERALRGAYAGFGLSFMSAVPAVTPAALRIGYHLNRVPHREVRTSAQALHPLRVFPKLWDSCWAVPLARGAAAFRTIQQCIREEAAAGRYPVNIAVHARVVKGGRALLSPTLGRDSMFIEMVTSPDARGAQAFYAAIGRELMDRFDALPHWGKKFHHLPRVAARYGERLDAFEGVRRGLDPEGTFINRFVDSLVRRATPRGRVTGERPCSPRSSF